jgi:hypothetical protein
MPRLHTHLIGFMVAAVLAAACTPAAASAPLLSPVSSATGPSTEVAPQRNENMKIRLTVGETVNTATLTDSETTRDFLSLLPLTLTLEDYVGKEKISMLPKRLSTAGAPSGSNASVGDITYYAPWGNLAIFYQDSGYANGLVVLGRIDDSIDALNVPGSVSVTIERIG